MTELIWAIDKVTRLPDANDTIYQINFTVSQSGVNIKGETRTAKWSSYVKLDPSLNKSETFIKFNDVTEDDLISWVIDHLGERRMDNITQMMSYAIVHKLIEDRAVDTPLPWEKN